MNRYWKRIMKTLSFFSMLFVCFIVCATPILGKTILTKKQTAEYLNKISHYEMNKVTNPTYGSIGGEWLIMGLARYGTLTEDYLNTYLANLKEEVEKSNGILSEKKYTEYARVSLALTSVGVDPRNFAGYDLLCPLAEWDNVVRTGLNGAVFALLAFDSGNYDIPATKNEYTGTKSTREKLISILLNAQLDDGGWAYAGSKSDADMTAMVLQALGKYYKQEKVKKAVDKGVKCLSAKQNDSGAFSSGGVEDCESTAQVLIAMTVLGIDVSDGRFVKKGNTILDGLLQYYKDGGFKHTSDSFVNQMSTEQAMYGLTAYYRSLADEKSLYDMEDNAKYEQIVRKSGKQKQTEKANTKSKRKKTNPESKKQSSVQENVNKEAGSAEKPTAAFYRKKKNKTDKNVESTAKNSNQKSQRVEKSQETPQNTDVLTGSEEAKENTGSKRHYWPGIVFGAVVLVGVGVLIRRKNKLFIMLMLVCLLFSGCDKENAGDSAGTCTILVECSTIYDNLKDLDKGLQGHIPKDGVILKEQEVSFEKGDSVYDVLLRELKKNHILVEVSFTAKSAYVEGIDNIYEFSCGELSGWVYCVNDEYSQVSCSDYKVKDGDKIQWRYTCDLGEDVK